MISINEFKQLYPRCKNPEAWVEAMEMLLPKYNITTPERIAAFISQCGHESAGWKTFEENLNYSAEALNRIFPKYFINAGRDAYEYHRQPEKIANIIYANRMGNGDTESGEGYKYRGRGPIQLTGKNNYKYFDNDTNLNTVNNPNTITRYEKIGLLTALWYWQKNDLNSLADNSDVKGITKRINGGYIGLQSRIEEYKRIFELLTYEFIDVNDEDDNKEPLNDFDFGVLKRDSKGDGVKFIQTYLGLEADGWFGRNTEIAVIEWQKEHGLYPDGIVGPKTIDKMLEIDKI